jgi:3-oxoacyl-(acyl-carrier-protein) synthase/NAD(P)-dependent dehydrogenase (short-subunit alcohol dehydrogenase family)
MKERVDIAIIGISGRFPGAKDLQQFEEILRQGKDLVLPLSGERIKLSGLTNDQYLPIGAIEGIANFDHDFFGIAPGEAQYMDPHQRILLEVSYHAIENAGYATTKTRGTNTGVFLAHTDQKYHMLSEEYHPMFYTGTMNSIVAGRISRFFDFHGPSLSIDTACSSSLVALHQACRLLAFGEIDMALVAAAKIILFPKTVHQTDESGILSADGKSKTFSADANGAGVGEGACAILIKRLDDANRDRDLIHAVIKGSAINQDAAISSSLTAPSSIAQSQVITQAWENSGVDPKTIFSIEAHGTGTRLGDPIEIDGITRAFEKYSSRKQFCAISSLKSNLGHLDYAAGLAGVIKSILSMRSDTLFPSVNFSAPNPLINFIESPVYVNARARNWPPGPKRCGVSSFGISGTNCHIVLEEAQQEIEKDSLINLPTIISVSGCDPSALQRNLQVLYDWLKDHQNISLSSLSYTLTNRRKNFQHRWTTVVESINELLSKIEEVLRRPLAVPQLSHEKTETWFVFSSLPGVYSERLSVLSKFSEVFDKHCKECYMSGLTGRQHSAFILQYCLYQLFASVGIASKKLIGSGYGRIVVDVLKGSVALKDVGALWAKYDSANIPDLQKLEQYISSKNGFVHFYEIGQRTIISEFIGKSSSHGASVNINVVEADARSICAAVASLHDAGHETKWDQWSWSKEDKVIDIPSYVFKPSHTWLEIKKRNSNLFYKLDWKEQKLDTQASEFLSKKSYFVCWMPGKDYGNELCSRLEAQNVKCIKVCGGDEFIKRSEFEYEVGTSDEDLFELKKELSSLPVSAHIFFSPKDEIADLESSLRYLLYLPIACWRVFALHKATGVTTAFLTINGRAVSPNEKLIPINSTVHGLAASLAKESAGIELKCIDVDSADDVSMSAFALLNEINSGDQMISVAYRRNTRYVPAVGKLQHVNKKVNLLPGTYLVTGGLSGIGLEIVKSISSFPGVHVAIVGRTELPARSSWDELPGNSDLYYKVKALQALQAKGGRVDYFSCNVSDRSALDELASRFPPKSIRGIIHSAGIGGDRRAQRHTRETFRPVLLPKIHGTINLVDVFGHEDLDFFIMFSSHDAISGVDRGTNYSAGNIFLDSIAQSLRGRGIKATSLQWGFWAETGMGYRMHRFDENERNPALLIHNNEGVELFFDTLSLDEPSVILSKADPSKARRNRNFITELTNETENAAKDKQVSIPFYNSTWTAQQNEIAFIWNDVLKVSGLSLTSNFFHLGGHSLLGIRVRNFLEKKLGYEVEFADIVKYPVLQDFAHFLSKQKNTGSKTDRIRPSPKRDHYEISHGQKRIWLAHQLDETKIAHIVREAFQYHGDVRADLVEKSFNHIVRRHEMMRTVFSMKDGVLVQTVQAPEVAAVAFTFFDYSMVLDESNSVKDTLEELIKTPFDLESGPLVRCSLFCLSGKHYIIVLMMHHIITDGWSLEVLWKEFMDTYTKLSRGEDTPSNVNLVEYKDYSIWSNGRLKGPEGEQASIFWKNYLSDLGQYADLPLDYRRLPEMSYKGQRQSTSFNRTLSDSIREFCLDNSANPFILFLTATAYALHLCSGSSTVMIGVITSGRDEPLTENMLGYFLNTVPVRIQVDGQQTAKELVAAVRENVLNVFKHQWYPFDLIIRDLQTQAEPGRNPLFDVVLNMVKVSESAGSNMLSWEKLVIDTETIFSKFDLALYIDDATEYHLMTEFRPHLMTGSTAKGFTDAIRKTIESIVANPEMKLGNTLAITDAETMKISRISRSKENRK